MLKIAVMGSGGKGGYYGGLLARAGNQVSLIARGAHLAALQSGGLRVESVHGDFVVAPIHATDRPAAVGPVDWVLVCVKTPDTQAAAEAIRPMLGPETAVTSLQNGVDAAERIGAVVGMRRMVGGATWVSSVVEAPGVIRQVSAFRRVVLGELDGRVTPRVESMVEALRETGITAEISDDIRRVLWTKFVFIAPFSAVGSLTRLPIGAYRQVPETRRLLEALIREVEAVALASGVALDPDVVPGVLALVDGLAPEIKTSMQRDIEMGRRSELEALVGAIGRLGRQRGVPTPAADLAYAALLPGELLAGARVSKQ